MSANRGQTRLLVYLFHHLGQLLLHAFPPNEGVSSGAALQFGSVHKYLWMKREHGRPQTRVSEKITA